MNKIFKKSLAFMLALIFSLSALQICVFAEEEIEITEPLSEYAKLAYALNFFDGAFTDEVDGAYEIQRESFAKILCNILKFSYDSEADWANEVFGEDNNFSENEIVNAQSPFEDVITTDSNYYDIIAVNNLGLMRGKGQGLFEPTETISITDATKVLVQLLGYDVLAKKNGGYPYGYTYVAGIMGIYKGIDNLNGNLTVNNLSRMLYNMFDINLIETTAVTEFNATYQAVNKTFLKDKLEIYTFEGTVDSNKSTTLTMANNEMFDAITVNGTQILLNEEQKSYRDYIGRSVVVYCEKNDMDRFELLYLSLTGDDDAFSIASEKVREFKNNTIYYEDENEEIQEVEINAGSYVIYNGVAIDEYNKNTFMFETGEITLLKAYDSNMYNVVVINKYDTRYVQSVANSENKIYFKPMGDYMNELNDSLEVLPKYDIVYYDAQKNVISSDAVKTGSILEVAKNGSVIRIVVTNNSVAGFTVTGIDEEENLIYGEENAIYKVAGDYFKNNKMSLPKLTEVITLYLDSNNRVIWYEDVEKTVTVGYATELIKVGRGNFNKDYSLRIYTAEGRFATYMFADKLKLTDENGIEKTLKKENFESKLQGLKGMIVYTVNANKEIKSIKLPVCSETVETDGLYNLNVVFGLNKDCTKKNRAMYNSNNHKVLFNTDGRTKVITVPTNGKEEMYSVEDYKNNLFTDYSVYSVTGYSFDTEFGVVDYLINYYDDVDSGKNFAKVLANRQIFIVDSVKMGTNKDGDPVAKIAAYSSLGSNVSNELVELYSEMNDTTDASGRSCSFAEASEDLLSSKDEDGNVRKYVLSKGDIIMCTYNVKLGKINDCYIIYKANMKGFDAPVNAKNGYLAGTKNTSLVTDKAKNPIAFNASGVIQETNHFYGTKYRFYLGYVIDAKENLIKSTTQNLSNNSVYNPNDTNFITNTNLMLTSGSVVTYSGKNKFTIKNLTQVDIKGYVDFGSSCSKVLIISNEGGYSNLIIINGELN